MKNTMRVELSTADGPVCVKHFSLYIDDLNDPRSLDERGAELVAELVAEHVYQCVSRSQDCSVEARVLWSHGQLEDFDVRDKPAERGEWSRIPVPTPTPA
jgi:hypothetical protein